MSLTINSVLKKEITKLDHAFLPPDFQGDVREIRVMQAYLRAHINAIGEKSTKAQGLTKVLTSMEKLRSSDHILYVLKDAEANNGAGELIGILKMGVKSLYLHDELMKTHQVSPVCILDFYILEEYQKKGYGKKLFDFMLGDQCTSVHNLAIDNPSKKLENFLQKHYKIEKLLRQNNCFAVSNKFFQNVNVINHSNSGRSTPTQGPVGRYTAQQPASLLSQVIHGDHILRHSEKIPAELKADREKVDRSPVIDVKNEPDPIVMVPEAKNHERPSSLKVRPITDQINIDVTPAGISCHPTPSLTREGYVDLKFYHNKLW